MAAWDAHGRLGPAKEAAADNRAEERRDYLGQWHDLDQKRQRTPAEDAAMRDAMSARGFRREGVTKVNGIPCWDVTYPQDSAAPRPIERLMEQADAKPSAPGLDRVDRAIEAVSRLGAQMRLDVSRAADIDNDREGR